MDRTNEELDAELRRVRELSGKGDFRPALDLVESLCRDRPDDPYAAYERAALIGRHLPPYDGLAAAKAFAERFPDFYGGPVLLARSNIEAKKGRVALIQLGRAAELGAPKEMLLPLRARALKLVGRAKEAKLLVEAGTDPVSLWAKFDVGPPRNVLELEASLEEMRKGGVTEEYLTVTRSAWYARHGMMLEARRFLRAAITSLGPSVLLSEQLAWVEFRTGEKRMALNRLSDILAEHPENLQVRRSMAWFSLFSGRVFSFVAHLILALRYSLAVDPRGPKGGSSGPSAE